MILKELFGDNARVKILEELISKWGIYLSVDEISRMSGVSKKSIYTHMDELKKIGILNIKKEGSVKYKLKEEDERSLALGLIGSNEYLRQYDSIIIPCHFTDNKRQVASLAYVETKPEGIVDMDIPKKHPNDLLYKLTSTVGV